ncbi:MAG: patatin-like phospholipase family protein [Coleofasciculaceae cyanobacterium SM2_3_26]|nr:patatin-like phospholipase family protein [Coleofasciculaceae cyanobacterium SM2_3_26]
MPFRILSIDGGGIRGVIAGTMLAEVERQVGKPAREYFHAIAGNSTGANFDRAVGNGTHQPGMCRTLSTARQRDFSLPQPAFHRTHWIDSAKRTFCPQILRSRFGAGIARRIGNGHAGRTGGTKSINARLRHHQPFSHHFFAVGAEIFVNVPLWEAVAVSAAGPTKFPARRLEVNGRLYSAIDGGVGANNPSGLALAEALKLGNALSDITVLSLGNGENTRPISLKQAQGWGARNGQFPSLACCRMLRRIFKPASPRKSSVPLDICVSSSSWIEN